MRWFPDSWGLSKQNGRGRDLPDLPWPPCGASGVSSLVQETAFGDPRNGVFFVGVDKVSEKNIPKMLHIWGMSFQCEH